MSTITTTRDYAAEIESAFGFTPDESLVLLSLEPHGAILRVDLADLTDTDPSSLLDCIAEALTANGIRTVCVAYYTLEGPAGVANIDATVSAVLERAHATRVTTIVVDEVPSSESKTTRPRRSRKAEREAWESFQSATPDLAHYLRALDLIRQGDVPTPSELGAAAKCLTVLANRDAVVVHLTGATLPPMAKLEAEGLSEALVGEAMATVLDPSTGSRPGDLTEAHRALLEGIADALPATLGAPAQTILGLIEWWAGNTNTALIHLTTALTADPDYRLAHLIGLAASRSMRPGWQARS